MPRRIKCDKNAMHGDLLKCERHRVAQIEKKLRSHTSFNIARFQDLIFFCILYLFSLF